MILFFKKLVLLIILEVNKFFIEETKECKFCGLRYGQLRLCTPEGKRKKKNTPRVE